MTGVVREIDRNRSTAHCQRRSGLSCTARQLISHRQPRCGHPVTCRATDVRQWVRLQTRCARNKGYSASAPHFGCPALPPSDRCLLAAPLPHWPLSDASGPPCFQAAAHQGTLDLDAFRTMPTAFRCCRAATRQCEPGITATSSQGGEARRRSCLLFATPSWRLLAASCLSAPSSSPFCTRHDGPPSQVPLSHMQQDFYATWLPQPLSTSSTSRSS